MRLNPGYSRKPIDTLEDLVESDMDVIILPGSMHVKAKYDVLNLKKPPKYLKITEALQAVYAHPLRFALYSDRKTVEAYIDPKVLATANDPFYVAREISGVPSYLAIHFQKGCVFKEAFDIMLLRTTAAALYENRYARDAIQKMHNLKIIPVPFKIIPSKKAKIEISLKTFWVYFVVLFISQVLTTFVFLFEVIIDR